MRTRVDIDDDALEAAAEVLGTATTTDTVNAALAYVARRGRHRGALFEGPLDFGVGSDVTDEESMRQARR